MKYGMNAYTNNIKKTPEKQTYLFMRTDFFWLSLQSVRKKMERFELLKTSVMLIHATVKR